MLLGHSPIRIGSQNGNSLIYSLLNPSRSKIPKFCQNLTLIPRMVTQSGSTKRPTCPLCSKPTRICLCNRLKTPALHNSVAVTILQHSLEKKHPLNSARIATLGLENVDVVSVSDVNFEARFVIGSLERSCLVKLDESCHLFDEMQSKGQNDGSVETSDFDAAQMRKICNDESVSSLQNSEILFSMSGNMNSKLNSGGGLVAVRSCTLDKTTLDDENEAHESVEGLRYCTKQSSFPGSQDIAIHFTIGKYGAFSSFNHCWKLPEARSTMQFDELLASEVAYEHMRKGFLVKKHQVKPLEGSDEYQESEEFDIVVPPGSVLLFPSEESVDIDAVNFAVKNLIVLDGTWAKAKRMYNENPWLKLLPHIRLDVDKSSLYSEVRHQPRAGYLSTIESVVYALKAVGEDHEGLDGLLDVFESMVGDQRRCKNERLSKASESL